MSLTLLIGDITVINQQCLPYLQEFFSFFFNWRNAIFPIPVEKKIKPIRTFLVCFYFHKGDWPSGNGISPSTSHGKFCWGCCCLVMYLFLPDMDLWKYQLSGEYLIYILCLISICHFFSDRSMK